MIDLTRAMEMLAWARSYDAYPEPVFVVDMDAIDDAFFRWLNERTDTSWVCPFADFAVIVWEESNDGAFGRFPDGPYGAWSVYRSGDDRVPWEHWQADPRCYPAEAAELDVERRALGIVDGNGSVLENRDAVMRMVQFAVTSKVAPPAWRYRPTRQARRGRGHVDVEFSVITLRRYDARALRLSGRIEPIRSPLRRHYVIGHERRGCEVHYRSGLTGWRSPTTVRGHQRGKGVPLRQLRLVRR
jgi:hypothetical protein